MLEIINLVKKFKTKTGEFTALDNINIKIEDGEIFGIIGLSGGGKSTLIRCINQIEKPNSGKVLSDGKDLTQASKKELNAERKKIAMIFQNFNLFEQRTALENVCFPMLLNKHSHKDRENIKNRALQLLESVGMRDKAENYPAQLSGGQKQRVAIARAIAAKPKYLLCDEATSALDPEATASILEILKDINKTEKITILVITHELSVIKNICDRVAVIEDGKICECEKVENLFKNPSSAAAKRLLSASGF